MADPAPAAAAPPAAAPPAPPAAEQVVGGAPAHVGADSILATAQAPPAEGAGVAPGAEGEAAPEAKPEGEAPPEGAPEAYDLKLPEGTEVDPVVMGQFTEFAKTNGLSQEAAQSALDLHLSQVQALSETFAKGQLDAWAETISGWKAELAKDPNFSGDNAVKAQTVIGRALDEYGSPEAREAFAITGAGHNPAIIKMIHSMALALDEGTHVPAGGPVPKGMRTPGEIFYGQEGS